MHHLLLPYITYDPGTGPFKMHNQPKVTEWVVVGRDGLWTPIQHAFLQVVVLQQSDY